MLQMIQAKDRQGAQKRSLPFCDDSDSVSPRHNGRALHNLNMMNLIDWADY